MNDDFLHRLRREPPPAFARELQRRLRLQEPETSSRWRIVRNLALAFAIVGAAYAGVYYLSQPKERGLAASSPVQVNANAAATSAAAKPTPAVKESSAPAMLAKPAVADVMPPPSNGAEAAPTARFNLFVVGAEPVHGLVLAAARIFSRTTRFALPRVEEKVPSATQFQSFCGGDGAQWPDMLIASGRIGAEEFQACIDSGASRIVELKLGYAVIVVARSANGVPMKLSARDLFLALAKWVPDPADPARFIANPHGTWYDVNPELAPLALRVFAPSNYDRVAERIGELLMEPGCDSFPALRTLKQDDPASYASVCHTLRDDGVYEEVRASELVAQYLGSNPDAIAIVSPEFFARSGVTSLVSVLDGGKPTPENIESGSYLASRPIYLYAKRSRINAVPGAMLFINDLLSDRVIGPDGAMTSDNLVPMSEAERRAVRMDAAAMKELKRL